MRVKFLALRDNQDFKDLQGYSMEIACKARKLSLYKKAKTVMAYLSCGSEVSTDCLVNFAFEDKKEVSVPAITDVKNSKMQAVRLLKLENANQLVCAIRQPKADKSDFVGKDSIDLIFVPGIVFSRQGYRIGYGKGFYDSWLQDVDSAKTVGLAYDFQIVKEIPSLEYDLPVGCIVTEKRVIKVLDN
ncbi:MAG: 5-formyltetrahydrofolate cyclo-ligase [Endomicrobium sp.]|jgi:5-formyltetrahydrofolate cyclo-ligase|nr:5-formyltetrahydrofolate cyclo-ligase [Endomicrobium sp.]